MNILSKIKNYFFVILIMLMIIVLLVLTMTLFRLSRPETVLVPKAGAIFVGPITDAGWNECHYEGLKEACDEKGLDLVIRESVAETEEACTVAIEYLVQNKCTVIFLTSDGYDQSLQSIYKKYSDIEFYTVSPESNFDNVKTYYARVYQMRYLCGMIAGAMTKTNNIGYLAGVMGTQTNRGINAFVLGAKEVNPKVEVNVHFVGSWYDPEREIRCTQEMIDDGADIITYHMSEATAIDVAEEAGVYSMGYVAVRKKRSNKFLTAAIIKWSPIYNSVLEDYLNGGRMFNDYIWQGIVYNAVDLSPISPEVPDDVVKMIEDRKLTLIEGIDVFMDDIHRTDGKIMCREDERISDNSLLREMDWFVEGVKLHE